MADKQIPGVGGAPLPAEDQYKPSFLEKTTGIRFAGSNPFRSQANADIHARARYETIKVWSDSQHKMVSAGEYLRETEPVEMEMVEQLAEKAIDEAAGYGKKKLKKAVGYDKPKEYVIKQTLGRAGTVGKFAGKAVSKVVGLDVETMGDATIDGARRRASDAIRQEYDQMAIHWKRSEVQSAVHGRHYEPNFLMGIENVRKVTDGMQDFTPRREDSSFVYRPSFDTSQFPAEQTDMNVPSPANERKARVGKFTKVTMNYDIRKEKTPIA
jgi:hypothetical protein